MVRQCQEEMDKDVKATTAVDIEWTLSGELAGRARECSEPSAECPHMHRAASAEGVGAEWKGRSRIRCRFRKHLRRHKYHAPVRGDNEQDELSLKLNA
ncbi:hypothetical protein FVE85_5425 [Porphyridium purpureum]|uniref:Uncharacterized protein n=1 Tax=Porphyridium purpureum TaxID=35688 RepID=A0A5J4Z3H3_PORPP|nr:hypothetical protein FVE85_5425 [Porphyridium purpureum]|eukprot:POR2677..scf295_1